jgi:hypothetical protein
MAKEHIRHHPGLFLLRSFNRVCAYFAFNTFAGAYLIETYGFPKLLGFAVIGLDAALYLLIAAGSILYLGTLSGMNRRTLSSCVLVGVAMLYAFPYFLAFSHPSYHYPIEPILMIFSSAFFVCLINRNEDVLRMIKHRQTGIAVALAVFGLIQIEFLVIMVRQRL